MLARLSKQGCLARATRFMTESARTTSLCHGATRDSSTEWGLCNHRQRTLLIPHARDQGVWVLDSEFTIRHVFECAQPAEFPAARWAPGDMHRVRASSAGASRLLSRISRSAFAAVAASEPGQNESRAPRGLGRRTCLLYRGVSAVSLRHSAAVSSHGPPST
jgi:hypothetical protein